MGTQQSTIEMRLIDGVTGPAGGVANAFRNLFGAAGVAGKGGGLMSGLLDTTVGQLAGLVSAYKAAAFAKEGFLMAAHEQNEFMRIRQRTGATIQEVKRAREAIDEMTAHFGLAHDDMVEGFKALAVGGRSFADSLALLPEAALAAQGLGISVKDAANAADALNAQMKVSARDMPAAFDMIKGAAAAGNVSVNELVTILPSLGAAARLAGMTGRDGLQHLLAILETIRPNFANSAEAATSLEQTLSKMTNATMLKKFEKFGIDLHGRFDKARKSGQDLFEVFYNASLQLTKGDLSKLPEYLGKQAGELAKVLIALRDNGGAWQANAEIARHYGEVSRDAAEAMAAPEAAINRLAEAWRKAKEETGQALIDAGAIGALKWATEEIRQTVKDFLQLVDDIRMIGVRLGLVEPTKIETARVANEKVNKLEEALAEYRSGKQTPVKEQLAIKAQEELDKARAARAEAVAAAQAEERAAAPAKPPVAPTSVSTVVKPLYDLTGAGPTTPLEAVVTPKVERGPDLVAPMQSMGEEAGHAAGVAAGNSLINSMMRQVEAGIGGVAAAIQSKLGNISVKINPFVGAESSMRDGPTPGHSQ